MNTGESFGTVLIVNCIKSPGPERQDSNLHITLIGRVCHLHHAPAFGYGECSTEEVGNLRQ